MMLRGKTSAVRLTAELADGSALPVDLRGYLTPGQIMKVGRDPDLVRRLAVHVKHEPLALRREVVLRPDGRFGRRHWAERYDPHNDDPGGSGEPGETADVRTPVAVRALVLTSFNDRRPQLLIDPTVDLAAAPPGWWGSPDWVMPLIERPRTLEEGPWREDVRVWDRVIEKDPRVVRALAEQRRTGESSVFHEYKNVTVRRRR